MSHKILKHSLPSFCTSNFDVINSLFIFCKNYNLPLLIETTSNQVNQTGGYSGESPNSFKEKIFKTAKKFNFNEKLLILGGDHLGPLPWKKLNSSVAIKKSKVLIREYVNAGYKKIHVDTTIKCKDDKILSKKKILERTFDILQSIPKLNLKETILVLGSEVPPAGGGDNSITSKKPTTFKSLHEDIKNYRFIVHKKLKINIPFYLVVDPGIGYGNKKIYNHNTKILNSTKYKNIKNFFKYEAHSTDYQSKLTLKKLIKNKFYFLKVGPEVTFSLTKAILQMCKLEKKFSYATSDIKRIIIQQVKKNNKHWKDYYKINELDKLLFTSYLDRVRYYWGIKKVKKAKNILFKNINQLSISQITRAINFKKKHKMIIKKFNLNNADSILLFFIFPTLEKYYSACGYNLR